MDPNSAVDPVAAVVAALDGQTRHPLGRGRRQGRDRQDDACGPDRGSAAWVGGRAHR